MASINPESDGEILTIHLGIPTLQDETTIRRVYQDIISILERAEERVVVLDFAQVEVMSSSVLGMLIRVNRMCKEAAIALKLSNVSPNIREVFTITGLDKIFHIRSRGDDDGPGGSPVFAKIKPRPSGGGARRDVEED